MQDQQASADARLIAASNLVIADAILAHTEAAHKVASAMAREAKLRIHLAEALKNIDGVLAEKQPPSESRQ